MTDGCELAVSFPDCSIGEANQLALDIRDFLMRMVSARGLSSAVTVTVEKEDNEFQDFGATLAILLGTPAAFAVAKGIHDWISARGHAVVIKTRSGEIIATGGSAQNIDIAKTVEALERPR